VLDDYLVLGLRLGRHIDGFVDAYYGPSELAAQVEAEPLTPAEQLAADAAGLRGRAESDYLRAQLLGCETTARRLAGEAIDWIDEVERCYGVRPEHTDEAQFAAAHEQLDRVLPGTGDVGERHRGWRAAQEIPRERLLPEAQRLTAELRARTSELFGLPDGEQADLEAVENEPWAAFNYYLCGRRSRVVINTDLPVHAYRLPDLIAHELYPGHHTEHAWKEALLVDERGDLTETIFLVGTPQATISEGIASLAPELVVERDDPVVEALEALEPVAVNAAIQLHVDGRSRDEVVDYIARWTLVPREHAEKRVEFLTHPTWRAYISSYTSGYALCKAWVGGDVTRFRRLLTEQLTTSDLAA
jgi:Bacterial protein of unknown function (DUF885)